MHSSIMRRGLVQISCYICDSSDPLCLRWLAALLQHALTLDQLLATFLARQ